MEANQFSVLAVMDASIHAAEQSAANFRQHFNNDDIATMREARANVAELIEAAQGYITADDEPSAERLVAAIARCNGEGA